MHIVAMMAVMGGARPHSPGSPVHKTPKVDSCATVAACILWHLSLFGSCDVRLTAEGLSWTPIEPLIK
jgi:hypothetical protein